MDIQLLPGMDVETFSIETGEAQRGSDGPVRLRRPDSGQCLMRPQCLEDLMPPDHQVRIVWALVERPDLSGFYDAIRVRGSSPSRSAKARVDRIERTKSP